MHPTARKGFSDTGDLYEKARPEYPKDAIEHLLNVLGVRPGRTVLDLAAGTGKLTRHLLASGADVMAVEPLEGMRAKFSELLPDVAVMPGSAEGIPFADASLDTVIAANSFHWFDAEKAYFEIGRVLKPGGTLGVVWHSWSMDGAPAWVVKIGELIGPYVGSAPRYQDGAWKAPFESHGLFTALESRVFMSREEIVASAVVSQMLSVSFIAALPQGERDELARRMASVLAGFSGPLVMPYRTDVFWCFRVMT